MVTENDWRQFISTGTINHETVREIIAESWMRCKKLGMDPLQQHSFDIITGKTLKNILLINKTVLDISTPIMENLYQFLKGSNFILVLSDSSGYIIKTKGSKEALQSAHGLFYSIGVRQTEDLVGTSAISLVQKKLIPLQVSGWEHYCSIHHDWTCSAAPILDESGQFLGILSIAGPESLAHPHTLGMVETASKSIADFIRIKNVQKKLHEVIDMQTSILDAISDGLIMLNKDGIVQYINPIGAKTLHIDRKTAANKHLTDLVEFDPVILPALDSGVGYTEREFFIETKFGTIDFIKTAIILKDEEGNVSGAIDIFRETNRVKALINKMTGATAKFTFEDIIGKSPAVKETIRLGKIAANGEANVLIQGESGTGKELIAQSIHQSSARRSGPFIAINCGAIPRNLVESELFGYEGGAFTGAKTIGQPGKFEMAMGGTIFLDEIADMPIDMQVKLLRVIQEKRIMRIGGSRYIDIDVRILAATNCDLVDEIKNGNFRADLYYRLNVLPIFTPPLRSRADDILLLTEFFLKKNCDKLNISTKSFDSDTLEIFKHYSWPGNIRELENVVERLLYLCPHDVITADYLPKTLSANEENIIHLPDSTISLKEMEVRYIQRVFQGCNENITQTAKKLGIGRNTLYTKLREL